MYVIMGLGQSGLSIARFLSRQGIAFWLADTRINPPQLDQFKREFAQVQCFFGDIPLEQIVSADCMVVSPGLSRQHPIIQTAIHAEIPVIGDIELFAQHALAPIVAITGTNAKGTVTTMTAEILKAAGKNVLMGGNIGIPALDLLSQAAPDFYVLELSSFQLESTFSLKPVAATILNLTKDHLDYHGTMRNYLAAKQRIYLDAKNIIYNRDDVATVPVENTAAKLWTFGLNAAENKDAFGIQQFHDQVYLTHGDQKIMPVSELTVFGQHNWANALAACALTGAIGVPVAALRQGLKNFRGLPYRCEKVLEKNGVSWINDSKGTNVGATLAALAGIGPTLAGKIILIAGGQGKGQDFSPLLPLCQCYVSDAILLGQDAPLLEKTLSGTTNTHRVETLLQAIKLADTIAKSGDVVLLSPVCASLDMFKSYEDRGEQFEKGVLKIVG